jgi:small-conductance mechanosensitive channel
LITSPIKTYSSEEVIRLETTVSVHYDTDIEKAKEIIKTAINALNYVVNKEKTFVTLDSF